MMKMLIIPDEVTIPGNLALAAYKSLLLTLARMEQWQRESNGESDYTEAIKEYREHVAFLEKLFTPTE